VKGAGDLIGRPRWRIIRVLFQQLPHRTNGVRTDNQQPQEHPEQEDLLAQSIAAMQEFLARNWLHMVLVVAVAATAVVLWRVYTYRHQTHVMAAWGELGSLPATELQLLVAPQQAAQVRQEAVTAVEDILQNSPRTSATPWALLQLGSLQADGGNWAAAARAFSDLSTNYPKSEPVAAARAALATSMEGLGKYKEAAAIYKDLAGGEQPYYLLSAGRCLELAGEPDAARQFYEKLRDLKTTDEDLVQMAAARLDDIALGQPLPPPPAVQPSAAPAVPAPLLAPSVPPATATGAPPAVPPAAPSGDAGGENR
jgi:tetratricopeptide (TPR) repeat protein